MRRGSRAGKHANGAAPLHECAAQRRHHQVGGRWTRFGVGGGAAADDVVHELEDGVLEAAAGAEERSSALPGVTDRAERSIRVGIGARGHAPDAMIGGEEIARGVGNRRRVEPGPVQVQVVAGAGEGQGTGNGSMGGHCRVVVPDQSDTNG